jgi:hypothetical protein
MRTLIHWLLLMMLVLLAPRLFAADWTSRLQDGSTVTVDPDTNRATVTRGGVTTPLWDGAHRLQDGSLLITNGGVATPNAAIIESRRQPPPETEDWQDAPIVGFSPCEQLVRLVCGRQDQCMTAEACAAARQLLDMEREERAASRNPNLMTFTSGQCLKARDDSEYFMACRVPGAAGND